MVQEAQKWIADYTGDQEFDFSNSNELIERLLGSITQMNRVGFDLLLGRIFDEIGFNQIHDEIFKQLFICRISYPRSKQKTTEYLYRYKQIPL